MKKIISLIICTFVLFGTFGVIAAEEKLTIVSGSIMPGELDAPVSVMLRYEFSEDIKEPAAEDVTVQPATVSSVSVEGKILTIRLAAKMKYNTEHIVDLSKVVSVSGRKLSESESKIKFETKFGEAFNIFEDDFETGVLDTSVWRSSTADVIFQKEGDNGNYSRKAAGDTAFDNFIGSSSVYKLGGDFIIEFDILIDKETIQTDYATLLLAGNNGLSSKDENYKRFETKRLLGYDVETGKFGVLFDTDNTSASIPSSLVVGKVLEDGWNNILVQIKRETQSLNLYINGELLKDGSGKSDFVFPCAGSEGYFPIGDIDVSNIRHQTVAASNYSGGADACIYYDNISYREITAPIFKASSVKDWEKLSVTRPEIKLSFKNFPRGATLYLNDTPIEESNIRKVSSNELMVYPALSWEQSYTLSGKILGEFGSEKEFSLTFETGSQPDTLIETVGFFSEGRRVFAPESGNISAKVNFWQNTPKSYILIAACYKEIDGRIKMVSISSPVAFTSANVSEEKEVTVQVPEDAQNCFVEYIVLKDTLSRMPYESTLYSGSQVLK